MCGSLANMPGYVINPMSLITRGLGVHNKIGAAAMLIDPSPQTIVGYQMDKNYDKQQKKFEEEQKKRNAAILGSGAAAASPSPFTTYSDPKGRD